MGTNIRPSALVQVAILVFEMKLAFCSTYAFFVVFFFCSNFCFFCSNFWPF